jgi:hypothetical protein
VRADLSSVLWQDGHYCPEKGEKAAENFFMAVVTACKGILFSAYDRQNRLPTRMTQ